MTSYILYECCSGSLENLNLVLLPENSSSIVTALKKFKLCSEVLTGIQNCYNKGVLHADIKLDNIFLSYDGSAVIGDFSHARHVPDFIWNFRPEYHDFGGNVLHIAPEV